MDNKQLERTAYHEAGHAVMAWLCGLSVSEAEIGESGDRRGHITHEKCTEAIKSALIYAAGIAAEALFEKPHGQQQGYGFVGDWLEVRALDKQIPAALKQELYSRLPDGVWFADLTADEIMLYAYLNTAGGALSHHRREIEDLALALIEQGKIEDVSFWLGFRSPHGGRLAMPPRKSKSRKMPPSKVIDWLTRPIA